MELQNFITESIKAIISGVMETKEFAKNYGAIVFPLKKDMRMGDFAEVDGKWLNITKVDFDIAVTASNKQEDSMGGGIKVLSVLGLGASSSTGLSNEMASRIKFSVDIIIPQEN